MSLNAIIPAGGIGTRTGLHYNKIFYKIDGEEVILRTLRPFLAIEEITRVILVCNPRDRQQMASLVEGMDKVVLVDGGATRTESVRNGLAMLEEDAEYVIIHDGARPYITTSLIMATVEEARRSGSATLYTPITDTIKRVDENMHIVGTPNRSEYVCIETPQTFKVNRIKHAYAESHGEFTDDTQVYERFYGSVSLVLGSKDNKKITSPEDLVRRYTFGLGFDTHKLVEGRRLVLGGIEVPHTKGLLGHSDADVLTHAIMDSLLSAGGLRDIGVLFPDTSAEFKDIYSIELLERVHDMLLERGYRIDSISAVIMAEKPKLKDYIPLMVEKLASTLHIDRSAINLSATTMEGLGIVGREEGISSKAMCALVKLEDTAI